MRFLMLNWRDPMNPRAGGAERVTLGFMAGLVKRGHQVWWYTYDYPGGRLTDQIEGVTIVRGGGFPSSILECVGWYGGQPPFDLVIDQHHGIPWYAPAWCGTRCIAYIHEVLGPIWDAFFPFPLNRVGRWQERWTHRLYARVPFWTVSESTRHMLQLHGVRDVTVIPNGIHTRPIPGLEDKPISSPLRLATVSRLAPNKRVDHAILAVKHLRERGVAARLQVVGTGEVETQLRQFARETGLSDQVEFLGPLGETEKDRVLRSVHLLVHTSQREGWGLNVIEANAMGTPAVVYPVGGLVDSTVAGVTGWVASSETPVALAAAVADAVRDPAAYSRCRRAAWERSRTFHWDVVLDQGCGWLEQQALAGSSRSPGRYPDCAVPPVGLA